MLRQELKFLECPWRFASSCRPNVGKLHGMSSRLGCNGLPKGCVPLIHPSRSHSLVAADVFPISLSSVCQMQHNPKIFSASWSMIGNQVNLSIIKHSDFQHHQPWSTENWALWPGSPTASHPYQGSNAAAAAGNQRQGSLGCSQGWCGCSSDCPHLHGPFESFWSRIHNWYWIVIFIQIDFLPRRMISVVWWFS